METGYYTVKKDGFIFPARWSGEKWHSEHGHHEHGEVEIISPLSLPCDPKCECTLQPDGSVKIVCP